MNNSMKEKKKERKKKKKDKVYVEKFAFSFFGRNGCSCYDIVVADECQREIEKKRKRCSPVHTFTNTPLLVVVCVRVCMYVCVCVCVEGGTIGVSQNIRRLAIFKTKTEWKRKAKF